MDLKNNNKMIAFNLATGILTVVIQFAVSFFLSPFIVKNLGAEANGFTQLANNFVMYASLLTVSFNSMAGRFVSVSYHQNKLDQVNKYYSSVYAADIFIILGLLPISVFAVLYLQNIIDLGTSDALDVKILFACVFFNFFVSLFTSLYSISMFVKNAIFYMNLLNVFRIILNAVLLYAFFTCLPIKLYYVTFVALLLSISILPFYIRLHNRLIPNLRFRWKNYSFSSLKELFLSGMWNTINQCGHLLNTGLDLLLANLMINPFSMGLLAVSKTIPTAIIQLASTVNSNFAPSIVQSWATGDKEQFLRDLRLSMKISTVLITIPIMTFCCFGFYFYRLWQPTLDAKTLTVLSIIACSMFIPVAGTQTLYNVFTASNKLKVNSVSYLIAGLLNVVCVFIGIKYFPEHSIYLIAGVSTTLSIVRNYTITLPYVAKLLQLKWYEFFKDTGFSILCSAINVAVSLPFIYLFNINNWFILLTVVTIVALLTLFIESFLVLSRSERIFLLNKIGFRFKDKHV